MRAGNENFALAFIAWVSRASVLSMKRLLLVSLAALGLALRSEASVIINVTQVGSDVVFSASGSLDLTGAILFTAGGLGYQPGFISGDPNWYVAPGPGTAYDSYALTSFDGAFGTSTTFYDNPSSLSGDAFFIWGNGGNDPRQVGVAAGYVSDSAINSGMVFSNATIAGLFLTPGTYDYNIPNNSIILNIGGGTTVPDAGATALFLGLALAGVAAFRHRFGAESRETMTV